MRSICLLVVVAVTAVTASVTAYHIEPRTAAMSGKVPGGRQYGGVSQEVVACWDSLDRVELFAGAKGNGGAYAVQVLVDGDPVMTSPGNGVPDHGWVKFDQWPDTVAFTKGKTVTIRFTRGGSDSVT
jgi:hypothetical protein